jgi:hypothetical protein
MDSIPLNLTPRKDPIEPISFTLTLPHYNPHQSSLAILTSSHHNQVLALTVLITIELW